jgi:hypothetical protein
MKNTNIAILGVMAGIALVSTLGMQDASAHQLAVLFGNGCNDPSNCIKDVFFVLGHTSEPAFGNDPGTHDGKHGMEIFISDDATSLSLPQRNTALKFDKYFFEDVKKYNKAKSVKDADQTVKGIPIEEAYADPGHYIHRQIVTNGIYGYHVYGTIDYFGVGKLPVDLTFFCEAKGMNDPAKFEKVVGGTTFEGFGCPDSTDDIKFPKRSHGK